MNTEIAWFTKATATYKWGAIELDSAGYVLPANTRWYKTRAIAYSYARANFQKYAVARAEF